MRPRITPLFRLVDVAANGAIEALPPGLVHQCVLERAQTGIRSCWPRRTMPGQGPVRESDAAAPVVHRLQQPQHD
jgi:hypothetical protein